MIMVHQEIMRLIKNYNTLKTTALLLFVSIAPQVCGQQVMTLERCRHEAVESNVMLKAAQERIATAEALEKVALSQFFPKFDANAALFWNSKSIHLLSDEQQNSINTIGTRVHDDMVSAVNENISQITDDPDLAGRIVDALGGSRLEGNLNDMGMEITDAMNIDLSRVAAGVVSVRQPVFVGGRLLSAYKTAQLNSQLQELASDKVYDELSLAVDKAYWEYISLKHKTELAKEYCDLLDTLSHHVDIMVQTEVATQREVTQVRVKLSEARMNLTKATGGLEVARLALCQLCGLPLDGNYIFLEDTLDLHINKYRQSNINIDNRTDIRMAGIGEALVQQGVNQARAGLLPNIALAGSYIVTKPNLYNGFQDDWGAMLSAGVMVNIPLCHPGDIYALKAAKHKAMEAAYETEELRKLARLEVTTCQYQLDVAVQKYAQAESDLAGAEENLRLAGESFEAGVITASDLMMAQTAWLKAKSELLDARIDIRMKETMLKRATGKTN